MNINWGILSKHKSELYGFSILWIMLFHCPYMSKINTGGLVNYIIAFFRHGNCGVDIFLFLSGICLFFSMKQHNDDIKEFYYKRCIRIFYPLLFIDGFYWFYNSIIAKHNLLLFLKKITLLDFYLSGRGSGGQVWFVALLVPLYFLYPFIYKQLLLKYKYDCKIRWLSLLTVFIIFYSIAFFWRFYYVQHYMLYELAYSRIPVFLLGCCCGDIVYDNKPINIFILFLTLLGTILGIFNFYYNFFPVVNYYRISYLACAPCIALWFCILLDRIQCFSINKILTLFGEVSLELYLTHILLRYFARYVSLYGNNNLFNVYKYLFFVLLASYTLSKIVNVLCKQILQRKATG